MLTLVASGLAGGGCIDDADALRAGETKRMLGRVVKRPSTLGTFLLSFLWGHVRRLDRVSRDVMARALTAGAGPGDNPQTMRGWRCHCLRRSAKTRLVSLSRHRRRLCLRRKAWLVVRRKRQSASQQWLRSSDCLLRLKFEDCPHRLPVLDGKRGTPNLTRQTEYRSILYVLWFIPLRNYPTLTGVPLTMWPCLIMRQEVGAGRFRPPETGGGPSPAA